MKKPLFVSVCTGFLLWISVAAASAAEETAAIDTGDTAWIIAATALVLFMTIPGLSLFYAGLVRDRNVLSVLMHCFVLTCVMSVLWLVIGYSLAFSGGNAWVGDLNQLFLKGVGPDAASGSIPDILFIAFQMTFFIITPALIVGTWVERMKFSSMLLFCILWALLVYAPICHMVWAENGWLLKRGLVDLAGGTVVHITAGFAALVACIVLGKRKLPAPPHNLPMTVTGTAMLWVGWFGFNGGSGLVADGAAAMSIFVTHISAATAALTWMAIEWAGARKPSALGIATGSIAGLAAITPASGVAGPAGALIIGFLSGAICWFFSVKIKGKFGYDDSLDVFGVHGIGGLLGTFLAAIVGTAAFGGLGDFEMGTQIGIQLTGIGFTVVYTVIVTFVILKLVGLLTGGLRVSESDEEQGLDFTSHGETGYNA